MFQACGSEAEFRPLVKLRLWFTNQKPLRDRDSGGPSGVPPLYVVQYIHGCSKVCREVVECQRGHIGVYKDIDCTQIQYRSYKHKASYLTSQISNVFSNRLRLRRHWYPGRRFDRPSAQGQCQNTCRHAHSRLGCCPTS